DNPDVGVILLHRILPTEGGSTVAASSLAAPKDAKKAYEKALDSLKKRKTEDAVKSLEKAVEVYPGYAAAWCELGRVRAGQGQAEMARKSFDEAIKADPKFVPPLLEIAIMEIQAKRWKEVGEVTDRIVKLDSFDYPQAYFFNAIANYNLQDME